MKKIKFAIFAAMVVMLMAVMMLSVSAACSHVYTEYYPNGDETCLEDGTMTAYCTLCGAELTKVNTGSKLEHSLTAYNYNGDATCMANGTETAYCVNGCGKDFTRELANSKLPHVFSFYAGNGDATCTENGTMTSACDYGCGTFDIIEEENSAMGHFFGFYISDGNATCMSDGTKTAYCFNNCGAKDVIYEAGTKLPHLYRVYLKNNDATCTEDGTETARCERGCGTRDTRKIAGSAKGHIEAVDEAVAPTCTQTGLTEGSHCSVCNEVIVAQDVLPATGHAWGAWVETKAPTTETVGVETRTCNTCGAVETQEIPKLEAPAPAVTSVTNYTVTIENLKEVKEIRFAIGTYTTGSEIKAAQKNVTLDAATANKYITDGKFTYDLPWVGTYTFWVRFTDGSSVFLYTDVTEIDPYVTSYGVKLTVNDFGENYKDAWIAKGTFNSYSEIKASTAFKYQASKTKLDNYAKTTHDFTYTMTDPGDYTVLIRYNDGTVDVIHHTLTVTTPILVENGLQAIISNIPDIRIIRTAYGHYTDVQSIKNASTVRYFNNKTSIKDAEQYMIQYRDEGEVTIIVEYNDGYKHFFYYNVQKKVPTMVQNGNTVTFGNLDDMYIIRYAPGKYTTAGNIKNAPGVQYKKADAIDENGEILLSDLTQGRWSFMVQYNDESYNFYLIDVA